MITSLFIPAFALLMLTAAFYDAATMTIPNWIPGAVIVLFFVAAPVLGLGWKLIGLHALVGGGALVVGMIMFALNWIGGGDAKLFAAAALWMGWPGLGTFALLAALAGGILTVFLLIARQTPVGTMLGFWPFAARLFKPGGDVPYGIALCAGALLTLSHTPVFIASFS